MATTSARMVQAVTSPTAAHVMAVVPRCVFAIRRSIRIRASTGNAVMLIAMPMKSAKARNVIPTGASSRYRKSERSTASAYGTTMLVWLTTSAVGAMDRSFGRSSSSPITKRKSTMPISANSVNEESDDGAKRKRKRPGATAPRSDGPSTIPATISPITAGWPTR